MATYVLVHRHQANECRRAYAAWKGFDSPLRRTRTFASCARGDHRVFWTVEAVNERSALAQLPDWLAARTEASEVSSVAIP
jgi:hypothetical protein